MTTEPNGEHSSVDKAYQNKTSNFKNNNHHVVSIGVLITLCTIYLMIAGLQTNFTYYFKPNVAAHQLNDESPLPSKSNLDIQHPPLCNQIEVFTKQSLTSKEVNSHPKTFNRRKQFRSTKISGNRHSRNSKSNEANNKKKDTISKKSNTAEPIIYLFALVFIYLLLKAASDINQHYKTQNKGDKRLRRCSLQSYAQREQRGGAHLDRRASKDALMQNRHYIFSEGRSVSLDRFKRRNEIAFEPKIMRTPTSTHHPVSGKNMEPRMGRRLSVPVSINYQTVQVSPVVVHPELARRGSVINLGEMSTLPMPLIAPTTQIHDLKRRVRMINRH